MKRLSYLITALVFAALALPAFGCGGPRASLAHIEGNHILLDRTIQFEHDSAAIAEDSHDLLDAIARLMQNHSEVVALHVIGHTDSSGAEEVNQSLSEQRAASVETALRERGVSQTIDSRGAGESEQACADDTEECHAQNRRVEFVIELE